MNNLNPYTITWAILIPVKGIALKADTNLRFSRAFFKSAIHAHFTSKEEAIKQLESKRGTFNKEYKVLLITDKQFGNIQIDFKNKTTNLLEVATKKQLKEIYIIK